MLEKKVNIIGEFQSQILIALIEQFFFFKSNFSPSPHFISPSMIPHTPILFFLTKDFAARRNTVMRAILAALTFWIC